MVKAMENACLLEGGEKVISVTAQEQDGYQESLQMTSNGFDGLCAGDLLCGLCRDDGQG